jgi:hydroxylysine kinase
VTVESPLSPTLTTRAAHTALARIEQLVEASYGLEVNVERLSAERDEIFKLQDRTGRHYTLKVAHGQEDSGAIDFETRALLHVAERDPQLPTPRLVQTLDGEYVLTPRWDDSPPAAVRLFHWLSGAPLSSAPRSLPQTETLGTLLARLGRALSQFQHPMQGRHMDWDLRHTGRLSPLVDALADDSHRMLAHRALNAFLERVPERLAGQRSQVIYNDLNPHNVLVDSHDPEHVTGIIDFGDVAHTALINDAAIGAAYLCVLGETPLEYPLRFIRAYHSTTPLEPQELELIYDLMVARLVMTVTITEWRGSRNPQNSAYILKNTGLAWAGLERLSQLDYRQASEMFIDACENERGSP